MSEEIPFCPQHKRTKMVKRSGWFGSFWGCPKYPKCKQTINISNKPARVDIPLSNAAEEEYELILRLLEAKNAERMYQAFLQSDVYQTILGFSNDHMTDNSRMHYERFLESLDKRSTQAIIDIPSTIPYIASWILKRKEYFQLASFVFFIHKIYELHGFRTLPEDKEESWNYWTSRYHGSPEHLQEYHLKETLAKECPLFEWMLAFDWEQEVLIGSGTCDLVSETKDGRKIVVEVKRGNIRQGLGQIIRYRQEMKKRAEQPPTEGYIIGSGYPLSLLDDTEPFLQSIGLMTYTIQDNRILLIPWRMAKPI